MLLFGAETWAVTPPHGMVPGGFPGPGGTATDGAATTEEVVQYMVVHLGRGVKRGGGVQADGDLHSAKA